MAGLDVAVDEMSQNLEGYLNKLTAKTESRLLHIFSGIQLGYFKILIVSSLLGILEPAQTKKNERDRRHHHRTGRTLK